MSVEACASIVEKGDPPRFRAVMAAPVAARDKLFPLYAFNVEVARAPWVTSEPGIAEIRLQWWIDALGEIAEGAPVRQHEVVVPLAMVITSEQARGLIPLIEARQWDIYRDPFADTDALLAYLGRTSGRLLETAAALLGQEDPVPAQKAGLAQGIANWLVAAPALQSAGKQPLPGDTPDALRALAEVGLEALRTARGMTIAPGARPAFHVAAEAGAILSTARKDPRAVAERRLVPSPFKSNILLYKSALTGRF